MDTATYKGCSHQDLNRDRLRARRTTGLLKAVPLAPFTLLSWLVSIALPAPAAAQSGSISGVVKDSQQAVVPGPEVVLRNSRLVATPTAVTDSDGRYAFTVLQPGTYVVQVYLSGFEVQSSPAIVLAASQSATHDFVLALAGESQAVAVVGTCGLYRSSGRSMRARSKSPRRSSRPGRR